MRLSLPTNFQTLVAPKTTKINEGLSISDAKTISEQIANKVISEIRADIKLIVPIIRVIDNFQGTKILYNLMQERNSASSSYSRLLATLDKVLQSESAVDNLRTYLQTSIFFQLKKQNKIEIPAEESARLTRYTNREMETSALSFLIKAYKAHQNSITQPPDHLIPA